MSAPMPGEGSSEVSYGCDWWQSGSVLGSGFSCDRITGKSFSPGVFPGVR